MTTPGRSHIRWFRNTAPYINTHRNRTFVLMLGGDAAQDPNFPTILHDLALLHSLGVRLVLVHGNRPQIDNRLAAAGIESRFHDDMRITIHWRTGQSRPVWHIADRGAGESRSPRATGRWAAGGSPASNPACGAVRPQRVQTR